MYIEPLYENVASDPRLVCVATEHKDLRDKIDNSDWQNLPVSNADRTRLSLMRQMINDGQLYTPIF